MWIRAKKHIPLNQINNELGKKTKSHFTLVNMKQITSVLQFSVTAF